MKRHTRSRKAYLPGRPPTGGTSHRPAVTDETSDTVNEAIRTLRDLTLTLRRMLNLRTAAD
jgi:hypothetical protein